MLKTHYENLVHVYLLRVKVRRFGSDCDKDEIRDGLNVKASRLRGDDVAGSVQASRPAAPPGTHLGPTLLVEPRGMRFTIREGLLIPSISSEFSCAS
jgi:hypothetical protein